MVHKERKRAGEKDFLSLIAKKQKGKEKEFKRAVRGKDWQYNNLYRTYMYRSMHFI